MFGIALIVCCTRRDKYEPTKKLYWVEISSESVFETINEEELEHEFEGDGLNAPVNERGPDVPEPAKRLVQ